MSTLGYDQLVKNSVGDFFHVPSNYDRRVAKYTNLHLRDQEGVKTRQIYGSLCSIANGIAFSVPTHGTSMAVCAFAARRLYVAVHKLRLIQKELHDRGLELRPRLKRDWMIPVAVSLTAASITWGVDLGIQHLVPVGQLTLLPGPRPDDMFGGIPTANGNLAVVAHNVHSTVTGFKFGAHEQVAGLLGQTFSPPTVVIPGADDPAYLAMQLGFSNGVAAAQATEDAVLKQVGAMTLQIASEKIDFESLKRRNARTLTCRRLPWSTRAVCQECIMPIENGLFFHSCGGNGFHEEEDDLDDDEYDVCWPCYNNLKNDNFKAQLRAMYFAIPGDSFHPGLNSVTLIDLLGPKYLLCMACDRNITNGWYYDCWDCRSVDKRWTFCQDCYREGGGCARNKMHRLFSFPRSRVADFDVKAPYQKKVPKGSKETGRAACTNCHANIERGPYYYCKKCEGGNYVLCTRCHASEKHCWNSSHVLTKYYAWKYKRDYDKVPAAKWHCSNPDCLNLIDTDHHFDGRTGRAELVMDRDIGATLGANKEKKKWPMISVTSKEKTKERPDDGTPNKRVKFKFFFSCLDPACHGQEYGLCPPCYFTDLTCPIKEHDIYKCYFLK